MTEAAEQRWPCIQRQVEAVPLRTPLQYLPWRLARRMTHRHVSYPPGIYILAYHKIIDPVRVAPWEIAYAAGGVSREAFERQMAYLCRKMTPLSLTGAIELMTCSVPDRPYFVVTFDDGYSDVLRNAAPVTERFGLRPCMFVNGRFAGGLVYYRVLAALLTHGGHARVLRDELLSRDSTTAWSDAPRVLFAQTKNCYVAGVVEDAVESAYRNCLGEPADLGVHLTAAQTRELRDAGWEIGNHTFDHRLLSRLDARQIAATLARNAAFWQGEGVPLIDAIAVPNGAVKDVNEHVHTWLLDHATVHAFFCNGGVNRTHDRTQWLRFFGGAGDEMSLHEVICAEAERTAAICRRLTRAC